MPRNYGFYSVLYENDPGDRHVVLLVAPFPWSAGLLSPSAGFLPASSVLGHSVVPHAVIVDAPGPSLRLHVQMVVLRGQAGHLQAAKVHGQTST